jgi:ubiquinone/menaquinone biosynthesis C-methylase UbiE
MASKKSKKSKKGPKSKKFNKFIKTKKNKITSGNNENIDKIGLPSVDVFKNNQSFKDKFFCYYNEFNTLKKSEFNYKKYYKTYESGEQFKALVTIALKYEPLILTRLLEIVLKRFNPKLTNLLYNIITSKKSDKEIYTKLNNLYQLPINRFNIKKNDSFIFGDENNKFCKGYIPSQEHLVNDLNRIINGNNGSKVKKYLDVGCGNGLFAISLGKILKLEKNDIFGVDYTNFSDQGDWGREKYIDKFIFNELENNKPYPFDDNTFDLITMKMVLHHVKNVEFTLKEISRILKKNGILILIEHDAFTYADYMINDIEHGFYINVFKINTNEENYLNIKSFKKKEDDKSLGVYKYYSWPEQTYLVSSYGFQYKYARPYHNRLAPTISGTRSFIYFYVLNK